MNIPEPLPVYTAAYQDFKGVDFTSAICDKQHFPVAKNFVIKDTVEKRCGYEKIAEFEGRINGIYKFKLNGVNYTLVHSGSTIYQTDEDFSNPKVIFSDVLDEKSNGYMTERAFLLLTGGEIISLGRSKLYDDEHIVKYTVPAFENWEYITNDVATQKIAYRCNDENGRILIENEDYIKKNGYYVLINYELAGTVIYTKPSTAAGWKWTVPVGFEVSIPSVINDSNYKKLGSIYAKYGYEVLDGCTFSGNNLYIPIKYAQKIIDIVYQSSVICEDTSGEERYYNASVRLKENIPQSSENMHIYLNAIDIPVIQRGLTYFKSNSYSEDSNPITYDKLVKNHCGEVDFDGYNLMGPYVAYVGESYDPGTNNSSTGFTQGYVIEEPESSLFGSQRAWFLFEDGKVFSAYISGKYIKNIPNASDVEKGNKALYFVTNDKTNDPIPYSYTGKPFKILYCHETAAKLWQETKMWQCTIQASMQYGNGLYYFYSGNKDFPNRDWHSEINEPLNVSSVNYTIYGVNDEVAGYGQYGQYLAVFKKGGNDKNVYLRQAQYLDSLGVTFPVSVGVGGAMPVLSPHTVENLAGETLYLTSDGIYALTTLSTTDFQVTKKRSYFVDGKLKKEINPENAIACTWRGMYLLAINGNVYVLDGTQQKNFIEGSSNEYSYECLFWDNIPARIFFNCEEELYFGCDDGKIMRFCDKYSDDGEPIDMVIATKLDDDGDFMSLKKMQKKGTGILVIPHQRSSFDISFRYDSNVETFVKKAYADIFDFSDIDFERFTFETSENPRIIPFLKKSKKYRALQIILRSSNDEPISLSGIIKRYTINNYVKKG